MQIVDPNDPKLVLSPLADPVVGAIFANEEVAGLASESFISALLKSQNEPPLKGKIVSVTAQRTHASSVYRGCRVDIEIKTDVNEFFRYEIQIWPDLYIMLRGLFSAAHLFTENSNKGDTSTEMAVKMPKVVYINLLGYVLRKSNKDMVQPFKIMYTKLPYEVAIPNFGGYNIQLPRVLEMDENFDDDFYCWCYALYTAHFEKKTVKEVIAMTAGLQAFAERDAGFRQFNERYEYVAADSEARQAYVDWFNDVLRHRGMMDAAWQEGQEKGLEKGREEARDEYEQKFVNAARSMKNQGVPIETITIAFPSLADKLDTL